MYKCVSGTLVAVVPSSEGLVVAADSRAVIGRGAVREFSDNYYKIVEVARPFRTVISIPGTGVIHQVPEEPTGDLTNALATAPRLLDLPSVVKSCLESGPEALNEEIVLHEIPQACQAAVLQATAQEPDAIRQFEGKVLCTVVVATFVCNPKCSSAASFEIFIEPQSVEPTIRNSEIVKFLDEHQRGCRFYGECDYVRKYLWQGERLFRPHEEFFFKATIEETSAVEAEAAAVNLIEAASEMAKSDPPEFGIGGPIDRVLLGAPPEPVRLRWKVE